MAEVAAFSKKEKYSSLSLSVFALSCFTYVTLQYIFLLVIFFLSKWLTTLVLGMRPFVFRPVIYRIADIFREGGGVKISWMLGFVEIRGKKVWSGQV